MPKKKLSKVKKKRLTVTLTAALLALVGTKASITFTQEGAACGGSDRWSQKVLTDDRATDLKTTPKITTTKEINALPHADPTITGRTERKDIETQVYTIKNCRITTALKEADEDFHLAITDPSGGHMVVEIPNPYCTTAFHSEFVKEFLSARKVFMHHKQDYENFRFDITGVLFYDKQHSNPPTGNSPNNIELHPVIKIVAKPIPQ